MTTTKSSASRDDRAPTARQLQAEETRRKLLDSAVSLFSTRPYDDVSVSEIAEAASAAHGLVFHYFQSKRGIYREALRAAGEELAAVHDLPARSDNPRHEIHTMLRTHLAYMAKHEGLARRLVLGSRSADPEAWEIFEAARWQAITWVCGLLGLDPDHPGLKLTLRATAGAIDEATGYWLDNSKTFDIQAITDSLIEMLIGGLIGASRLDQSLNVATAVAKLQPPAPTPGRGGRTPKTDHVSATPKRQRSSRAAR